MVHVTQAACPRPRRPRKPSKAPKPTPRTWLQRRLGGTSEMSRRLTDHGLALPQRRTSRCLPNLAGLCSKCRRRESRHNRQQRPPGVDQDGGPVPPSCVCVRCGQGQASCMAASSMIRKTLRRKESSSGGPFSLGRRTYFVPPSSVGRRSPHFPEHRSICCYRANQQLCSGEMGSRQPRDLSQTVPPSLQPFIHRPYVHPRVAPIGVIVGACTRLHGTSLR